MTHHPAFIPRRPPERMSRRRAALAICGTLLASWCISVGLIWGACLLSGACT